MINGIYQINYRGAAGLGTGLLLFRNGVVAGADMLGGTYDGTYSVDGKTMTLKIKMVVPPGVSLVQGTLPQSTEYSIEFVVSAPVSALENSQPVLLDLPPGPVNAIFRPLRTLEV